MLREILPSKLYNRLKNASIVDDAQEIRLLVGVPMIVCVSGEKLLFDKVTKEDVEWALKILTRGSIYAVNDTLIKGYLTYHGGIRVGICGEVVVDNGVIKTIKHVNGLVIRVPHEKFGVLDGVIDDIVANGRIKNTLIIGQPFTGKTTYLREFARVLSKRYLYKSVVIDEKNELSATVDGICALDVGYSGVIVGVDRVSGIESAIRNLAPEVIITDEIYSTNDKDAIVRCINSGVSVIASMHGESMGEFGRIFQYVIRLGNNPIGSIMEAHDCV